MSDDFHRPTLTFPGDAYNATQVRLYGIGFPPLLAIKGKSSEFDAGNIKIAISPRDESAIAVETAIKGNAAAEAKADALAKYLGQEVRKLQITDKVVYHVRLQTKTLGVVIIATSIDLGSAVLRKSLSPGLIVGYSFEGHCYDLPKPKMMVIPTDPVDIPVDDCGYDDKKDEKYRLWIVDKLDECAEIDVSQGFIEQLVLEANLPGKRSPTMYAGRMLLGHRGGRLTE